MSRFARGYIPDPDGHRVTSFRHAKFGAAAVALPDSVDLTPFAPDPLDQSACGSCVGHALAGAVATSFARAGAPLGFVPSPRSIYQLARCIDRLSPSEPLTDEGSMPNQAIRSLNEWGIRPMRAPSPQGFNSDCDASNVNNEPTLDEIEQDATLLLIGQYAIDSTGAQRINDVCAALAAGYAVTVASFVDTAFEDLTANSAPYDVPDESDPNGGGHYLMVAGFKKVGAARLFLIQNSWGTEWGDGGRCWVTEAFIKQCSDIFALSVRKAAA